MECGTKPGLLIMNYYPSCSLHPVAPMATWHLKYYPRGRRTIPVPIGSRWAACFTSCLKGEHTNTLTQRNGIHGPGQIDDHNQKGSHAHRQTQATTIIHGTVAARLRFSNKVQQSKTNRISILLFSLPISLQFRAM